MKNVADEMGPVVETALGAVVGRRSHGVRVFEGIAYAQPPVAYRRFAPPQPVTAWPGLRDATAQSPIAPQLTSRLVKVMGDFVRQQDEDCLTLTIVTPDDEDTHRPVLVWLHGGGFSSGGGALDWYSGGVLARESGLVVVGVNYRLGALGFLRAPGISEGNLGILDQALALRFIANHISAFGGDPGNITVVGQSAGANSFVALRAGGLDAGIARRAILQSAALGMRLQDPDDAERIGADFLIRLGIDPDAANAHKQLLSVPVQRILEAQAETARAEHRSGDATPPFHPVGDGSCLPPAAQFAERAVAAMGGTDIVIGTTREEMAAFYAFDPVIQAMDGADLARRADVLFGVDAKGRLDRVRRRRPGATAAEMLGDLATEEVFLRPSLAIAEAVNASGGRAFVYQFDWPSPHGGLGACHCLELPFVFGPGRAWAGAPMIDGLRPDQMEPLSAAVRDAWGCFARDGVPNSRHLPEWPAYEPSVRATMRIDCVCAVIGDPAGASELAPKL